MSEAPAVVLVGASGHGKVVIDIVEKEGRYRIPYLVDDNPALQGKSFFGYRVAGATESLLAAAERPLVIVSIGDNAVRARIAERLGTAGFQFARAVHPHAQLGRGASLGEGTVVMAGAVVNADARIGENVIINTGASVDHDCIVESGAHIAPGARLCGGVRVGAGTLVGAGAVLIPGVRVGADTVVPAGTTVRK
jgi:sugar O-acyltransferase (sialic acid O-acetyltransferase NeuD family)